MAISWELSHLLWLGRAAVPSQSGDSAGPRECWFHPHCRPSRVQHACDEGPHPMGQTASRPWAVFSQGPKLGPAPRAQGGGDRGAPQ